MNAIELKVREAGTIEIERIVEHEPNRTDDSGALATYQALTPDSMLEIVKRHDNVLRVNADKTERSSDYTLRKAKNDWLAATALTDWTKFQKSLS